MTTNCKVNSIARGDLLNTVTFYVCETFVPLHFTMKQKNGRQESYMYL